VIRGRIFDVAVDVRRGSPTFGRWTGAELSDAGLRQMYVPPGFAHGFCVLSDVADILYKVTDFYDPTDEAGILWSDPEIGIAWPVAGPQTSARDAAYPKLRDFPPEGLPVFKD
jgi:dTDP-4-dehydrorhamnose 3,5-epimerase